jgi:hypothetical protein
MQHDLAPPTVDFHAGSYSFIPGVSQYSAGVASLSGYAIRRVRFSRPVPMAEGFQRIARLLALSGRPPTALCACELRAPRPFTEETFRIFNESYIAVLTEWGLARDGINPVARSCVCPVVDPPSAPSFYAFSYTVAESGPTSFVIAGSGEVPEGKGNYRDHIVRRGEVSSDAMREKANWVVDEIERRMTAFSTSWSQTTAVQVYTAHDLYRLVTDVLVPRGTSSAGLTWHFARPPIVDIEFEMDCRSVRLGAIEEV